jgi:hypothetical protein
MKKDKLEAISVQKQRNQERRELQLASSQASLRALKGRKSWICGVMAKESFANQ